MNGECPCKGPEHDPGCRLFESAEALWLRLVGAEKEEAFHWRHWQEARNVFDERLKVWLRASKAVREIKEQLP